LEAIREEETIVELTNRYQVHPTRRIQPRSIFVFKERGFAKVLVEERGSPQLERNPKYVAEPE